MNLNKNITMSFTTIFKKLPQLYLFRSNEIIKYIIHTIFIVK